MLNSDSDLELGQKNREKERIFRQSSGDVRTEYIVTRGETAG